VEYNDKMFLDYDGSQISPEWYGWMHYKTDLPPFKVHNIVFYINLMSELKHTAFNKT
jgi:NADH:ubiquinone oxidoreductase 17.2 kD subunit